MTYNFDQEVVEMTIDMHAHMFMKEFRNESFVIPYWVPGQRTAQRHDKIPQGAIKDWGPFDPDGTAHIKRMDEANIEKSVLLHIDLGLLFGEGAMTIEQQNKHVSEVAKRHPDRFIWFCGVDPRRPGAVELVEKCVTEWGARGIKMYPTTGFLPADKECYPYYERASAWKIPVYFHMGPQNPPFICEGNAHASTLLRVLVDFPDLTVIVAHLGLEFWRDLLALGRVRDNVMCDFCGWQAIAKESYGQFCYILRKFLDEFGCERVIFGTDAPILEEEVSSKEWVEMVKNLPREAPESCRFTEEEVSALLDGNARRLLASIPQR